MASPEPLGLAVGRARGASDADIVASVEQTAGGQTLLTIGTVTILSSGNLGRIHDRAAVRLTGDEREELIAQLMEHRFADITTGIQATSAEGDH